MTVLALIFNNMNMKPKNGGIHGTYESACGKGTWNTTEQLIDASGC